MSSKPSSQYNALKNEQPALMDAVEALGAAAKQAGPLDARMAHLIQLGAAAAARSEGAVHSHVRRAMDAGASVEEVRHAVMLLTNTIGFPAMVAALSWVDDLLER